METDTDSRTGDVTVATGVLTVGTRHNRWGNPVLIATIGINISLGS